MHPAQKPIFVVAFNLHFLRPHDIHLADKRGPRSSEGILASSHLPPDPISLPPRHVVTVPLSIFCPNDDLSGADDARKQFATGSRKEGGAGAARPEAPLLLFQCWD